MRRGKLAAQQRVKGKVVKHTAAEKLHLKHLKKKNGLCGKRRAERRKHLQPKVEQ